MSGENIGVDPPRLNELLHRVCGKNTVIVVSSWGTAVGGRTSRCGLMHGYDEPALSNLKARVLCEDSIERDSALTRLATETRRDVKVTTDDDIRVMVWLVEVPVEILQDMCQFARGLGSVALGEGQMEGHQSEIKVAHFELSDLRGVLRFGFVSHIST